MTEEAEERACGAALCRKSEGRLVCLCCSSFAGRVCVCHVSRRFLGGQKEKRPQTRLHFSVETKNYMCVHKLVLQLDDILISKTL